MASRTSRNVWFADQVLAALADATGPQTTADLADAIGKDPLEGSTWRALDWLARAGKVKRIRDPGMRVVQWEATRLPIPVNLMPPLDQENRNG